MPRTTFTQAEGLMIQTQQLAAWKFKLRPKVYQAVERKVLAANAELLPHHNGHQVLRGTQIDEIILNLTLEEIQNQ